MICRAPTGSTSCAGGTNTGQQLAWDTEGRLASWQDAPTSPTTTASYLYDGEGQRVVQKVITGGTTTTTMYVGSLAEYTTTGGTTSSTDYLYAAGKLVDEAVTSGGTTTLTYLVTNAQGTPLEALDGNGSFTASRLYMPYGGSRYTSGAFPTSYGYTGQRADATTGLDYYGARYYDPTIGQFTAADTLLGGGLNRYGYVSGNPVTRVDPSGHMDKPSVNDPDIQNVIRDLWRKAATIGDHSSMAALLQEASTGQPTVGYSGRASWHYKKVWDARNALQPWFDGACKYMSDLEDCQYYRDLTGTEVARLAQIADDLTVVARLLGYINAAIKAWEQSGHHTGIPGQNPPLPIVSAPPLPAPSPGIAGQPSVAPPSGFPAQPATPAPVPGFNPTQLPGNIWHVENRPTDPLPAAPFFGPPSGVPASIWSHEVMSPWTIGLLGGLVAVDVLYFAYASGALGGAGGGAYSLAGIPSVGGGLDMGGGNRDYK